MLVSLPPECFPKQGDFDGIDVFHNRMSLEQHEQLAHPELLPVLIRAFEQSSVVMTGLGQQPQSMDTATYDRWLKEKRIDAPRNPFHAFHGSQAATLKTMLSNWNAETGTVRVAYSRSPKITKMSSQPIGRMFGAGFQRLRRQIRCALYGAYVEVDISGCMPTALCDLSLSLLFDGDDNAMVSAGFGDVYRLGRGPREEIVAEVRRLLQDQIRSAENASDRWERLRTFKSKDQIIEECNRWEQERAAGLAVEGRGPFDVSDAYAKKFVLSVFLRGDKPKVSTPVTDRLWVQSNSLYEGLCKYAEAHQDHWLYHIHTHVHRYLSWAKDFTKKNGDTPKDAETGHSMVRSCRARYDPGFVEYNNPKGSFLALTFMEIEHQQIMAAAAYLREAARRYNATNPERPVPVEYPLIFDGILLPFDVPQRALDGLAEFVRHKSGGIFRPTFKRKVSEVYPEGHPIQQAIAQAALKVASSRLDRTSYLRMENIYNLHKRLGFNRVVNDCDIEYDLNGRKRDRPLVCDDYVVACMNHKPPEERKQMQQYIVERNQRLQAEAKRRQELDRICEAWERMETDGDDSVVSPEDELENDVLPDWYDVKLALSRTYMMPMNPPTPDKPVLERLRNGAFHWIDLDSLRRRESQLRYRRRGKRMSNQREEIKTGCAIADYILRMDPDVWVIDDRHPPADVPCGELYDDEVDGSVRRVVNIFRLPRYRYFRTYRFYRALNFTELEGLPEVRWYRRHIQYLFEEPEMCDYWLDYTSHIFQKPTCLPGTYIFLYSQDHGVGKDVAVLPLQVALGPKLSYVGGGLARTFASSGFTDIPKETLLVVEDEIGRKGANMDNINRHTTGDTRHSRQLYHDATNVPNYARLVATSNKRDSFETHKQERRQVAIKCSTFWHLKTNPRNFQEMRSSMIDIFGVDGVFNKSKYNPDAICALAVWMERRDIEGFDPVKIPDTEFIHLTRGGFWAEDFLVSLAYCEYSYTGSVVTEKAVSEDVSEKDQYQTTTFVLYRAFCHWWSTQNDGDAGRRTSHPSKRTFMDHFKDAVVKMNDALVAKESGTGPGIRWRDRSKVYLDVRPHAIRRYGDLLDEQQLMGKRAASELDGTFEPIPTKRPRCEKAAVTPKGDH